MFTGSFLYLALTITLVALIGIAVFRTTLTSALSELQDGANRRLVQYAAGLNSEIERFAQLPGIIALMPSVDEMLQAAHVASGQQRANQYLEQLVAHTGALAIYILDASGTVVATSNWRQPDSYLGENDAYRPYFREAMAGRPGRFFGIGTTRSEPGYYLSHVLYAGSKRCGVVVVKINLSQQERFWAGNRELLWVSDANQVVILASRPEWKFASEGRFDAGTIRNLIQTRQYNGQPLAPLAVDMRERLDPGTRLVRWAEPDTHPLASGHYLAVTRPLVGCDWSMTLMLSLQPVYNQALNQAALWCGLTVLLMTGLLLLQERRRRIRAQSVARDALQQACQELEVKVAERTTDLSQANRQLQDEITERIRAETSLRQTQAELVQAGKLAVIGQMSTELAHELNQPLTALRTLSANTVKYLARGNLETASSNLDTIGQLVERMGKLTSALRSFAYRSQSGNGRAELDSVIDNVLFLLEQRLLRSRGSLHTSGMAKGLVAAIVPDRLEMVLVNLITNALDALDALPPAAPARIDISAEPVQTQLRLIVRDSGEGLSESARRHLFEPFFTTKPAGAGLGLGLALSASIISDAGGTIRAENHPQGGAIFTVCLPLADGNPDHV